MQDTMTIVLCGINSLSDISKSLMAAFPSAEQLLKATQAVASALRTHYSSPKYKERAHRITLTSKQLLSKNPVVVAIGEMEVWGDRARELLEEHGWSEERLRAFKWSLLEFHIPDKDYLLLYLFPQDKNRLFPNIGAEEGTTNVIDGREVSTDVYCKYLDRGKCHHCGKTPAPGTKLQACGRCKQGCYCNRDCQAADWPEHKAVCKVFEQSRKTKAEGRRP
jgi:hypothetical protein